MEEMPGVAMELSGSRMTDARILIGRGRACKDLGTMDFRQLRPALAAKLVKL
ncbi:uncharacterized protein TrAFT101_010039 [Trichoderma asperellum]|uniref:uncharacterized protein n=1 Tax=Trichoderma asperellum TaxID=101201 RepID=UPI00332F65F8|nr:hypothetical protein TrAFT101_010039 [Trichoderma asperellum]